MNPTQINGLSRQGHKYPSPALGINGMPVNTIKETAVSSMPPTLRSRWRTPFAIVIAMTLLSAVVHGYSDGRWARPTDLKAQGQRLAQLPERCGPWVLLKTMELEENAARVLRCYGSAVRAYRNEQTKDVVTVAVLFGPRGPIAVHTPEICYSSVGTAQLGERVRNSLDVAGQSQGLWSVRFAEQGSNGSLGEPSFEVWYAWSDGGAWLAAENPRFWMATNLYKIQVAGPVGQKDTPPCKDFLKELLPQLVPLLGTPEEPTLVAKTTESFLDARVE